MKQKKKADATNTQFLNSGSIVVLVVFDFVTPGPWSRTHKFSQMYIRGCQLKYSEDFASMPGL